MSENRGKMLETLFGMLREATQFFSQSKNLSDDQMLAGVGVIADTLCIDRLSIWRNSTKSGVLCASQIYRWDRATDNTALTTLLFPAIRNVSYSRFMPELEEFFADGKSVGCLVNELPETSVLRVSDIKAAFFSPIFIHNKLWGFALFGDTNTEHVFDDDDQEMMRSAAFVITHTVIRSEMEREIADKNEFSRTMINAGPTGLVIFSDDSKAIECNEALLAMFGTTKERITQRFDSILPVYQPDGSKSLARLSELIERMLNNEKGEKMALEWDFQSPAGEPIPCEITLVCSTYQRKPAVLMYLYDLRSIKTMESSIAKLESMVNHDALTGICNRRYFDISLKRLMKTLSRSGNMLSLLLIDIDCFKLYNDNYGHIAGDECIRAVATILSKCITRDDDFVARYGGEEFAVVLPNTDAEGARMVAEKMLESIRKRNIPHEKSTVADHITISIGGATGRVHHTLSGRNYIELADIMLYVSKEKGRNQASFSSL